MTPARMAAILLALACAGCGGNMVQQPRDDVYERSELFADGKVMQRAPEGTLARDARARSRAAERPPVTPALLARGRERFAIYCAACHGATGRGDGFVTTRGFPRPPSYLTQRLRAAPAAHFVDVITNGYGVMYAYADRVAPADRWAIAAHIRALQAAQPQRDPEPRDADAR